MSVAQLISAERVLTLSGLKSKKRVLQQLSQLIANHVDGLSEGQIFSSLIGREKLGTTALGHGVAIPHGRVPGLGIAIGAFLRLRGGGVDFDAPDELPVDLVFALLVPEAATETHLNLLAELAELFSDEAFCNRLREAGDDQLLALLGDRARVTTD